MTKKLIQPLQTITHVNKTDRMGTEINPHAFWMTKEYILHLECGHQQVRTSCNFDRLAEEPGGLFPKRTRCKECPATESTSKYIPKPPPTYDPLAAELVTAARNDDTEESLLEWVNTYGYWIADDNTRIHVYTACSLAMIDLYIDLQDVDDQSINDLRCALVRWQQEPNDEKKQSVRKLARRVYGRQHTTRFSWYAVRGIIAACRVTGAPKTAAKGILESITWDKATRDELYENAFAVRSKLDTSRSDMMHSLTIGADMNAAEHQQDAQAAKAELESFSFGSENLGTQHQDTLLHLISVYQESLTSYEQAERTVVKVSQV